MDNLSSTGLIGIAAAAGTVLGAFVKIVLDWRSGSASVTGQTNQIAFDLINELRAEVERANARAIAAESFRDAFEKERQKSAELRRELDTVNSDIIPRLERRIDRLTAENERLDRAVKLLTKGENGH